MMLPVFFMKNDYEKRQEIINQIVNYAQGYKLDGINIDFENMYQADKDNQRSLQLFRSNQSQG